MADKDLNDEAKAAENRGKRAGKGSGEVTGSGAGAGGGGNPEDFDSDSVGGGGSVQNVSPAPTDKGRDAPVGGMQ